MTDIDEIERLRADLAISRNLCTQFEAAIGEDLEEILRLRAEIEKLKDPNAVHVNMLRGSIAKPAWEQIKHLYPEKFK